MRGILPALALYVIALAVSRYVEPLSLRFVTLLAWFGLVLAGAAILLKGSVPSGAPLGTPRDQTVRLLAALGFLVLALDVTITPVSEDPPVDYSRRISSSYPSYGVAGEFLQGLRSEVQAVTAFAGVERRVWLVDFRNSSRGVDTTRSSPLEKSLLDGYTRLKASTGEPVCEWLPMIVDIDFSVVIVIGASDEIESSQRLSELLEPCGELVVEAFATLEDGTMHAFSLKSAVG